MRERKPFEGLLGNTKELRAFQKLISMPDFDFNISELAKVVGVSRNSAMAITERFLEWGVVVRKMRRGNMDFYVLDQKSPIVLSMVAVGEAITIRMFPEVEEALTEAAGQRASSEASTACPSKSIR